MEGVVLINKPKGLTSHDVVRRLRRILNEKKIGHTGTLDPDATGLLLICVGRATKLVDSLTIKDKKYSVEAILGYETDSLDASGHTTYTKEVDISINDLQETIRSFLGEQQQVPPAFSAISINGKRAYKLARKGEEVVIPSRLVQIKSIDNIIVHDKTFSFDVKVSKGTYIRSLIRDIGRSLDNFATMTNLVRTEQGNFTIENSYTLEEIEQLANKNDLSFFASIEEITSDYPKINLLYEEYNKIFNGIPIEIDLLDGSYTIYLDEEYRGLATVKDNKLYRHKILK